MNKHKAGKADKKHTSKPFPIVAIGASAGGIEAITELLQNLSPETGMAFVYIQHLDPSHESMLTSILGRATKMEVLEAKADLPIQPNQLYVIPPNKDLYIVDGALALVPRKPKPALHMPIDRFFTSLAEKQQYGAIGIVLSGNAHDGTLGLKAIKAAGGLTIAQDESARFRSMPVSAISEGVVDMVLSPKQIALEIERLSKQPIANPLDRDNTDGAIDENDEDFASLLELVKTSGGVDFRHYKMTTIKRRINRRILLHKLTSVKDYLQYLKDHTSEINLLHNDLLINVTSFFRDPDAMEYMKKTLIPRLLKNKNLNDTVRVWIPACATGEEAYSLAILFTEVLGANSSNLLVQIFATDVSEVAITKARLGLYTPNDVAEVSAERLQRFFTRVDGSYRMVKSIRDMCIFAQHNVLKDPPFSRLDMVSCCNLMIYLDTVLQKKVLSTFHYAMYPEGFLVLGRSETTGAASQFFTQIERKFKIYARKKDTTGRERFEMNSNIPGTERNPLAYRKVLQKEHVDALEKAVDKILLEKYVPPSVVVNHDLEILHFRGSTDLFLTPSPGRASLNLLKMARPGLAFELRTAIHKANKSGEVYRKSELEITRDGQTYLVAIEVVPLKPENEERLFLVLFEEMPAQISPHKDPAFLKDSVVTMLHDELNTVKEDMRSMLEVHEASNEELQSANEEIVSSNEELQSINEELETSKEEIESTNEELITINTELQVRNEQLAEAYEYAEAVLSTVREVILVLDQGLRVKSANHAFYQMFNARPEDTEGMLIYELGNKQWDIPRLRDLLETIIPRNVAFRDFEVVHVFPSIGEKVMLVNACRIHQKIHEQHVIFVAIEDITALRGLP